MAPKRKQSVRGKKSKPTVEVEGMAGDTQNTPEVSEDVLMYVSTSTTTGDSEGEEGLYDPEPQEAKLTVAEPVVDGGEKVCIRCRSLITGPYGPRCGNPASPKYDGRVRDNDTCEEFSRR